MSLFASFTGTGSSVSCVRLGRVHGSPAGPDCGEQHPLPSEMLAENPSTAATKDFPPLFLRRIYVFNLLR